MDALSRVARRHAAPMLSPASGLPLIKSTPSLGRMLVVRRGRSVVDADMPAGLREAQVKRDTEIFIKWMEKEDGARFRKLVSITGPTPHLEHRPPDVQVGDRGDSRLVARSLAQDISNGKESYEIACLFDVPEGITEIPTDLAADLFRKGKPNLRPLRERDWKGKIDGFREYRSRNS